MTRFSVGAVGRAAWSSALVASIAHGFSVRGPSSARAGYGRSFIAPLFSSSSSSSSSSVVEDVYDAVCDARVDAYEAEHAESLRDPDGYWGRLALERLEWYVPFPSVRSGGKVVGDTAWFAGGKLNLCHNAVDRHDPTATALIWEGDEPSDVSRVTYGELRDDVSRVANALKSKGVRKGDVVTIYMPMIPQLATTMLACARIGAVHSIVFAGFSSEALGQRIDASESKFVVTANVGKRGGKTIPLKDIVDASLENSSKNTVQHVFVYEREENADVKDRMVSGRDVAMDELVGRQRPYCPCEMMDAEDELFILYTSGSTGQPKGLVHTTAGYALYAAHTTDRVFDLRKNDVFACVADCGWITGHTYVVYGPLLLGRTTLMFESTPLYPDPGRYWDMVQRHGINVFYTAPTAIRSLMRHGDDVPRKYDLSSLRVLGSVGEPINPEAWRWYYEVVGNSKCTVVDTYWQTETGGHLLTNLPGVTPMKPGSCARPFFGVDPVLLDPVTGQEVEDGDDGPAEGVLAVRSPWPGAARTCLQDHARYRAVYLDPYPGYYFTGDSARRDADGDHFIAGRVDDVLNVSGHRIGTAEVESALVAHRAVAQAAAVGFPHPVKGQAIACFATLTEEYANDDQNNNDDDGALETELRLQIRSIIGPFASPDLILVAPNLPMTRSGKIMRRILRKIVAGEADSLGDTSTLADPSVVNDLVEMVTTNQQ